MGVPSFPSNFLFAYCFIESWDFSTSCSFLLMLSSIDNISGFFGYLSDCLVSPTSVFSVSSKYIYDVNLAILQIWLINSSAIIRAFHFAFWFPWFPREHFPSRNFSLLLDWEEESNPKQVYSDSYLYLFLWLAFREILGLHQKFSRNYNLTTNILPANLDHKRNIL